MKKYFFVIGFLFPIVLHAQQNWQWRGENRNGMYLNETGLLREWRSNGPELLWHFDGLGEGHTSVAISNEKIYITGMHDDRLILYVLDMNGRLVNEREVGKEWNTNWNGTRSSVNINDGKLYIFNALGTLHVLDQATLNVVWTKDLIAEFDGRNLRFGMTENPLIVGDKIFMSTGSELHNFVALNKNTGALIWSSPGDGNLTAYASPIYISGYSVPIVLTSSTENFIAYNANTGEVLWLHPQRNRSAVGPREHPNTPIYSNGLIFSTSGNRVGSVLLRMTNGGRAVEQVWINEEMDNRHGGAIRVGDYVYSSGHQNRGWICVDWRTGETKWRSDELASGTIIYADGMLYCYAENGVFALVRPNPEKFDIVSRFTVNMGTDTHFAHPVIHRGVLYIRRGDTLMAYSVK